MRRDRAPSKRHGPCPRNATTRGDGPRPWWLGLECKSALSKKLHIFVIALFFAFHRPIIDQRSNLRSKRLKDGTFCLKPLDYLAIIISPIKPMAQFGQQAHIVLGDLLALKI